ncbi:type IX secretion system membrane protein PorP/SprF [Pseudobacter ginsenosidimutans]|nr:type IX secretion system membrane protein PorP/SprF [Pseudobacter ginsenosidimutans]
MQKTGLPGGGHCHAQSERTCAVIRTIFPQQGPLSPAGQNVLSPDLNADLLLNGKRFFAGVSMMQLLKSKFIKGDEGESTLQQHMLVSLGYMYPLD